MKLNTIMKLVSALAAVAGAIYIIATYGDKIVAWAKGIMDCCPKSTVCPPQTAAEESDFAEETEQASVQAPIQAEEAPEAAPAQEPEEEPALSEDAIPVADEEDFEG